MTTDDIDDFIKTYLKELQDFISDTGFEIDRLESSGDIPVENYPSKGDIMKLREYASTTLAEGCKDCGTMKLVFQAAISIESDCKVYFLIVDCEQCKIQYQDIMAVTELDGY